MKGERLRREDVERTGRPIKRAKEKTEMVVVCKQVKSPP